MLSSEDIGFYLSVFKELKLADIVELSKIAQTKTLLAGQVYIPEGSNSQRLAFIKKGLIRTYLLNQSGEEITIMLRWEQQFVASVDSIVFQKPSRYIYQAIEETTILEMDYGKAHTIINKSLALSSTRTSFVLNMLAQAMERIETFVSLSPEQRYLKLLKEKPGINNRVQDRHIATLLGITPVSLSRIRKRLAKRK